MAALREDPSGLDHVGIREVMDHLTEIVSALPTPPIIMGHSFGGTFAQLLVGAGLGSAGVSLDGAGVKGVKAMPFSEIKSTLPVLKNPANRHKGVSLDAQGISLLVHQHPHRRRVPGRLRPLRRAPLPAGSCSKVASPISITMLPRRMTSPTTTGRPCSLSRAGATTSCRRLFSGRTTKETPSTPR